MSERCLQGRVIVITGAAHGIGRAVARRYAEAGAELILLDKDRKGLASLHDELKQAGYLAPALYPINLAIATSADYEALATVLERTFTSIHGLFHNAAHFEGLAPIEHLSTGTWFSSFQVNVHAPFLLTQALLPHLKQSKQAVILFHLDENAQGKAFWGGYAPAKRALKAFAEILAEEFAHHPVIQVRSVDSGPCETSAFRLAYPGRAVGTVPLPEAIGEIFLEAILPNR